MPDPIAAAIDATETPVLMAGVRVRLSSGREIELNVPPDITGLEALELIGYISIDLPKALAARRRPSALNRLVLPTGIG